MVGAKNRLMTHTATMLVWVMASAVTASAQSLGDLARREETRRKSVTPGKVYTNDALRPSVPPPADPGVPAAAGTANGTQPGPASPGATSPDAEAPETVAPPAPDTPKKDEAYWRTRIKAESDALDRAKVLLEALQSRVNSLQTDFINRDDPAARAAISAERVRALGELDRIKLDIQQRTKAVNDIREEARRAGAPAAWYR